MKTRSLYKRIALMVLLIMGATGIARAYDFVGTDSWGTVPVYYNLVDGNAVITNNGKANCYSGTLDIPSIVVHDGHNYTVTAVGDSAFMGCRHLGRVGIPSTVTTIGRCAFMNCYVLNYQTVSENVTTIGDYAFKNCTAMSAFYLYSGLETIGKGAFMNCRNMLGLGNNDLGNKLTTIGDSAFMDCGKLDRLILGYAMQSIGKAAFAGCEGITSLTCKAEVPPAVGDSTCFASFADQATLKVGFLALPRYKTAEHWDRFKVHETFTDGLNGIFYQIEGDQATVTYRDKSYNSYSGDVVIPEAFENDGMTYHVVAIGDNAFKGSTGLTGVTIPETVTSIGNDAFEGCSSLTRVTIPASVTGIGDRAFSKSGITEMTIPSSVTSIGDSAFAYSRMVSFTLSEGFTSTGAHMLEGCQQLTTVNLPESLTTIAAGTFINCYQLTGIDLPRGLKVIGEKAFSGCSDLTDIILPDGLEVIDDGAFKWAMSSWTLPTPLELVIPESVTYLGKYALAGMMITHFTLPPSITTVSAGLLENTMRLESVTLHDGVTAIGPRAFYDSDLPQLELPASVKVIGDSAFISTDFPHFTIPNTVDSIGRDLFKFCRQLESVYIGSGINKLGDETFQECKALAQVTFDPSSQLTGIGARAFAKCEALEFIELPATVKTLGSAAFQNATRLKAINLPDSLSSIGEYAFDGCSAIERIELPSGVKTLGRNSFYNCGKLADIKLNDDLESIGESSFARCSSLRYIKIPDKVLVIHYNLFHTCPALEEVVLGKGVKTIEKWVFNNSNALKSLIMLATTPPTFNNFAYSGPSGLTQTTNIYVHNQAIYGAQSSQWKDLTLKNIYNKENVKMTQADIVKGNDLELTRATLYRCLGDTIGFEAQNDVIAVTGMMPAHNDIAIGFEDHWGNECFIDDVIETDSVRFSNYTSLRINNKLMEPMFTINCDNGFVPDSCGVIFRNVNYPGNITLNYGDSCVVECAPFTKGEPYSHKITPWVAYQGITYTGETRPIREDCLSNPYVSPTAVDIPVNMILADKEVHKGVYFTFEGKNYPKRLKVTGLDPETTYQATCTVNQADGSRTIPFEFTTPPLRMGGTEAATIDQNVVRFKCWSNIVDEETGCGFEWERVGVEGTTNKKPAYSFDGSLANIVNRIAINTAYRFRPYYKSATDSIYYGEWKEFSITETPGNHDPILYNYGLTALTPTTARVRGLVLAGSNEIQSQGFNYSFSYWSSDRIYVEVGGQLMECALTGLKPNTRYWVHISVHAGNYYNSNDIYFTTPPVTCDVNLDGEINIADVNAALDIILNDDERDNTDVDVNNDREGNIADINAIIDMILSRQ